MADTTILIIEDEAMIADMVVAVLSKNGYRGIWNGSARDALEELRAGKVTPNLILLDGILPGMDGWEFMKELGKSGEISKIPIVTMSSLVDFERSKIPPSVNVVGKLDKPFTAGAIVDAVRRATGGA
ncbi:MAG TPA: response regulator [bacterium]|nr:response regulator [bacterium]